MDPLSCVEKHQCQSCRWRLFGFLNIAAPSVVYRRWKCATHGVVIPGIDAGRAAFVFLTFGNILADEAALKAYRDSKGASSLMPCVDCWNMSKLGAALVDHDASGLMRELSCANAEEFRARTSETCWVQADTLAGLRPRLNNEAIKDTTNSL